MTETALACYEPLASYEPEPLTSSMPDASMSSGPVCTSEMPPYLAAPGPTAPAPAAPASPRTAPLRRRRRDPPARDRRRTRRIDDDSEDTPEAVSGERIDAMHGELRDMLSTRIDEARFAVDLGARHSETSRRSVDEFGAVVSGMRERSERAGSPDDAIEADDGADETGTGHSSEPDEESADTGTDEDEADSEGKGEEEGGDEGEAGVEGEEGEEAAEEEDGGTTSGSGGRGSSGNSIPRPDTEPAYLVEPPFENIPGSPQFGAALNFPEVATTAKDSLPSPLADYRQRFTQATATARNLYDGIVAQAGMLALQVRQEDNRRASQRVNDLAQAIREHDLNLAKARLNHSLNVGHDLRQHDVNLRVAIRMINGAAAGGKARMAALAAGFPQRLRAEHGMVSAIDGKILTEMDNGARAQTDAIAGLNSLVTNAASQFNDEHGGHYMTLAVNETLRGRIAAHVAEAVRHVTDECTSILSGLANQAATLQPQMIKAFCQFTNWENLLRVEAPLQLDTAAAGSVRAARKMARKVRKQIITTGQRNEASLITQANQQRKQLIATARARSSRERTAAQMQDGKARGMTLALGAAPVQAVSGIQKQILRRTGAKEEDVAGMATGFADGVTRNAVPQITARKTQARALALAGFGQLQTDSLAGAASVKLLLSGGSAALDKLVQQSRAAGKEVVSGTRNELFKLAKPVTDSANGTIRSVNTGFDRAKGALADSLAKTSASVEASLSGTPPPAAERPEHPPPEVPCEGACCDENSPNSSTTREDPPEELNMTPAMPEGPRAAFVRIGGYKVEPKNHPTIDRFITAGIAHVQSEVENRTARVRGALSVLDGEPNTILPPLRGLTPYRAFAMRELYSDDIMALPNKVRKYLNIGNVTSGVTTRVENINAAMNYLSGNAVAGAHHELNAAVEWSNENERIIEVMHSLTPAQMAELNTRDLSNVRDDLGDSTKRVFDELRSGDVDAGRASALTDEINTARSSHNEAGMDAARDALSRSYTGSGSTLLQGANIYGVALETETERNARRATRWNAVLDVVAARQGVVETGDDRGNALAELAAGDRTYTVRISNEDGDEHGRGTTYRTETRTDVVRDSQRLATRMLIRHGPDHVDTLAANMAVELGRPGGVNQDRLRAVTAAVAVNPAVTPPGTHAYEEAMARRAAFMSKVNEFSPTLTLPDGSTPTTEQLTAAIGDRLAATAGSDTATGNYLRDLLIIDPTNAEGLVAQLNFAMDGAGTNVDALKHTLRGLTREQFDEVRRAYDAAHPGGPDLLTRIGIRGRGNFWDSETSGDAAQDLEILSLGIPRTPRERAEVAAMQMRQQIRDSTGIGNWLAGDAFSQLEAGERRLMNIMGADHMGFNDGGDLVAYAADDTPVTLGNFDADGNYRPTHGRTQSDLEVAIAAGPQLAENYKNATDRIANAITTTLIVAAAVISTVLTGGAAASIWIPMLVTFGAGVAGMIVNRAIKGARYGHEEMFQDFAVTLVQTLTAGAGAAISLYARGGMTAVRAVASRAAMSEKLLERFLATKGVEMAGMGLARQVAVGAATGAIGGAGNAMIDGEAWRRGTWGTGILHGMARGALGGGVSAAAARPFARFMSSSNVSTRALARGISSGIGGAGSRGTEIFYDYNRGTYRGTLGDAFGEMRDAGIQNAIQGVGEAYGEHIGDRGAMQGRGIAARFRGAGDRVINIEAHYNPALRRGDPNAIGEEGMVPVVPRITGEPSGAEPPARRAGPSSVEDDGAPRPPRATPDGADEAGSSTSRRRPADEEALGPARLPDAEGDAPLRILPGPDDQPLLRSILPDDASVRAAGDPPGRVLTPANDNAPAPVIRVALTAEAIVSMRPVGENTVVIHPDARNLQAANDNYRMLIEADPTREVGIFRNPQTGEYIVVQGRTSQIKVPSGDITGAGAAPPRWITERHFHPNVPGQSASGMIVRMPSGVGGDFTQIIKDLISLGGSPRQSSVDYMHEGRLIQTDFGVDPSSTTGRFWISYPDPVTGVPTRQNFASMADYHAFVGQTLRVTYNFPTGMGEPVLRSIAGGSAEHPNALAPGSRATVLSDTDHSAIRALAAQASALTDMVPVMRSLALNGAPEHVVAAMQDSIASSIEHLVPTLREMGLVDNPDAMARLHLIVNQADIDVTVRQAIIDAVLVTNREAMIAGGTLQRNQAVMAMLHGAPGTRSASIRQDGIDLARLGPGRGDDFARGLYLTTDLEAASKYTVRSNQPPGEVFPFLVRMADLSNAIDMRPGGSARLAWDDWIKQPFAPGANLTREYLFFHQDNARGTLFTEFLQATGRAATHPGLVIGDLGGDWTPGIAVSGRISNQLAISNQAMAEILNTQLGNRRASAAGSEADDTVLRSIIDAEDPATPKPITTEGETTLAKTAAAETGPTAGGAEIPPPRGYTNWHEVPDAVRAGFEAAALVSFKATWNREGAELMALVRHDEATAMRALQAEDEAIRSQAIHDFEAAMIAGGLNPTAARQNARLLTELANVAGPRYRLNLRHAVELDIWQSRMAGIPVELRPMATDSSLLLFLAANHPKVLTDLHTRFENETVIPPGGKRTTAMFEDFVARTLHEHPLAMPGAEGRRILRFGDSDAELFNDSCNDAAPLTRYEFGKLAYTTDEHGRVAVAEGVPERVRGPRSSSALQTTIGNEGAATDVGFHLIAHIFGAEINRLAVVPGNGKRIPGDLVPNLNGSAYKVEFENVVRNILDDTPERIVEVEVRCAYNSGNHSDRPDFFHVRFRTDAGTWVTVTFPNKQ